MVPMPSGPGNAGIPDLRQHVIRPPHSGMFRAERISELEPVQIEGNQVTQ